MADFRRLSDTVLASPQISLEDIAAAKEQGITLIVNNRPDGEDAFAPQSAEIEAAAQEVGIAFRSIPITHAGFSAPQVAAMVDALDKAGGAVLAYCRSGTRSTLLWALAQSQLGRDPEAISSAAREAGYDVSPVRPAMDALAAQAKG